MFKTTFVDANGGSWLAGPVFLPTLPERGDPVNIKEKVHHGRATTGHVTRREWTIVSKDPGESEVVISLALD
jgi:hypothetical protein